MSTIETNNTIAQPRQAVAPQSQNPGSWYNPLPNPYAYGLPTNGGNIYSGFGGFGGVYPGGFGGMYPGGFGGMYPGGFGGMYPGGFGTAQLGGNVWGGYDFQNNNPNGAVPSYGYNSVVAPTHFQTSLSGDGTEPLYSGTRVYQDLFAAQNAPLVNMGTFAAGAFAGMGAWAMSLGRLPGLKKGKPAFIASAIFTVGAGLATMIGLAPKLHTAGKAYYAGLDHAENGHVDGSYATKRNNDLNLLNIFGSGR